jgi:cbb3-type cytochrome oxidase subunit 3
MHAILAAKKINDAGNVLGQAAAPTGLPTSDVYTLTGQIIRGALTAVGTLFLLLMVYGGYLWMTARGNEDQVTKSRNVIIAALIGLIIIVGAYAATSFVTQISTSL